MQKITGSFVAIVTPFNKDGSVDFVAFRELLKFQEDNGTAAILFMGSTGETSDALGRGEEEGHRRDRKMKTAKMPLFYGCTGNNTETTIENVRFAKDNGADGAILARPPISARRKRTSRAISSTWRMPPTCRSASITTRRG